MPEELRLVGSFAVSLTAALILVPLAVRFALRTGFLDVPVGYKGHARATPYLGGAAVVLAAAIAVLAFGAAGSHYAPILIWALVLFVVGTIDDKRSVNLVIRLVIEIGAGYALWHYGLGWSIFGNAPADIALTILWVVGLVNAFNLMDNMDGASASVAGVSALGTAAVALIAGDVTLAVIVLAVAGACAGFLPFNLAKPARIFLGDGGSMPVGFVVAGAVMALPMDSGVGSVAVLAAAPLVGLPILDTTLVLISRSRGGRPLLSGGRDHVTHRLRSVFATPRLVAACLAGIQALLCGSAILLSQTSEAPVIAAAIVYALAAGFAILALENMPIAYAPGASELVRPERTSVQHERAGSA